MSWEARAPRASLCGAGGLEWLQVHFKAERGIPVAGKHDEFEFKTVNSMKQTERLLKKGWDKVESSGRESWFWGSDYKAIMRRPNPKYVGPKLSRKERKAQRAKR